MYNSHHWLNQCCCVQLVGMIKLTHKWLIMKKKKKKKIQLLKNQKAKTYFENNFEMQLEHLLGLEESGPFPGPTPALPGLWGKATS